MRGPKNQSQDFFVLDRFSVKYYLLRIMLNLFTLGVLFSPRIGFSFSQDKCGDLFPKSGDAHRPYLAPIYSTTIGPSVTSYFSSIGKCSMYGTNEGRMVFIKATLDQLMLEASAGGGEYVNALAGLSGCKKETLATFALALRSKFSEIFSDQNLKDLMALTKDLDIMINSDKTLKPNCAPPSSESPVAQNMGRSALSVGRNVGHSSFGQRGELGQSIHE